MPSNRARIRLGVQLRPSFIQTSTSNGGYLSHLHHAHTQTRIIIIAGGARQTLLLLMRVVTLHRGLLSPLDPSHAIASTTQKSRAARCNTGEQSSSMSDHRTIAVPSQPCISARAHVRSAIFRFDSARRGGHVTNLISRDPSILDVHGELHQFSHQQDASGDFRSLPSRTTRSAGSFTRLSMSNAGTRLILSRRFWVG